MDYKKKKREDNNNNTNFNQFPQNFQYNNFRPNNFYYQSTSNIPPITKNELEGIVVDYLINNQNYPIDSFTLFRNIKSAFRNIDYSVFVFKNLDINSIIRDLIEHNLIECEEIAINLKRCYLIKNISIEKLKQFKEENLDTFTINQDFDKYSEKAKSITLNFLKGDYFINIIDDLMQISYSNSNDYSYYYNMNQVNNYTNKKRQRDIEQPIIQNQQKKEEKMLNEEEEFINNFLFAPTAKAIISSDHYKDAKNLLSQNFSGNYSSVLEKIKTKYGSSMLKPFCEYGTREECAKHMKGECHKVHFKPIIGAHTDTALGDCSYLDTCRHMEICRFVHYQIEESDSIPSNRKELILSGDEKTLPSQWINCDIRYFDYSILGKFDVIMADPPWDIHMDLPYGTLSDDEMKNLPVKNLQDEGVIFLWVTGRATELARECLELWGYERREELVWIKTNQLQRLIRTGRTGHWLNHSKEHCLIGIKGNPKIHKNVDCDVLVSEVRETSRKPDEIYELIERMKPGGRKLELFARAHNRRQGWISLGNQLPGIYFVEKEMIDRFNKAYPENPLTEEIMNENRKISTMKKEI
jgi:mRNA (2'-O-methyladenosine-N6-)-methyltransferase